MLAQVQLRGELRQFLRRMAILAGAIFALLVVGTAGFALTEGPSIGYSFVWALDTVATVGSIPGPQSTGGQIVKVVLIVLGVGTLFYGLVTVTEFFVAGHLSGLLEERRLLMEIDSLSDHILICGFGRVGRQAARDLRAAGRDFVVITLTVREMRPDLPIVARAAVEDTERKLRHAGADRVDSPYKETGSEMV